ncbi:MAG: type II secretion system protein [Clostridia bacterium]|nr:type II secretion system protein [Clostridia bacterium]
MLKMNNEKGVTMLVLVITIIVLLILAGVGIFYAVQDAGFATDKKLISELNMVATAVHEQYIKYQKTGTKEFLVGESPYSLSDTITKDYDDKDVTVVKTGWYKLDEDALEEIGINNSKYEYAVKYETGEVYNITMKETKSGKTLYTRLNK